MTSLTPASLKMWILFSKGGWLFVLLIYMIEGVYISKIYACNKTLIIPHIFMRAKIFSHPNSPNPKSDLRKGKKKRCIES